MSSIAKIIHRLIDRRKTDGLAEKVDVLYLNGELTTEEYGQIMARLKPESGETEETGDE